MAKKKIMIVDDEPDTIVLAKAILQMNDFEALDFTSPEEALAAIERGAKPDLVILDMRMPNISGPDFCDKLKEKGMLKNMKIVFFTASSDLNNKILAKHGAIGFIFKPFDNDQLVADINKYLES